MHRPIITAALLAAAALPAVAQAQQATPPEPSVFDGNYLTIGGAAVYTPSYEGSNDMVFSGVPLVQGRIAGVGISPRAGGIALDFFPDPRGAKIGFAVGPVATYSRNRRSNIHDDVVRAAGKLKSAVDVGVSAGVTAYRLLDPYDSLTISADVKWNVNDAYKGSVVTPSISYATPLSRAILVTLNAYAKRVDGDYADYYYQVSPLQSARSGLPVFAGRSRTQWAAVGGGLLAAYDLGGNLADGGLALVAGGTYAKLFNDAAATPYTALRGDRDQWTAAAGLVYTF